ncbi:MAG: SRPBCC domain-containing protein [Pseudomonadota bacterium]
MNDDKKYADKQVFKVFINAPIETVWSELVNTTKPRPFFWGAMWDTPEFAPDNPYRMVAGDGKIVAAIGRILEMEPPHKMVHSFRLTASEDETSKVTYLLKEIDGGTEFSLINENVLAGSKAEKSKAQGAQFIVDNLKAYVETGKVTLGAQLMLAMYGLMAPMTPKSMRTENWPFEKAE